MLSAFESFIHHTMGTGALPVPELLIAFVSNAVCKPFTDSFLRCLVYENYGSVFFNNLNRILNMVKQGLEKFFGNFHEISLASIVTA
jgi:hypothetical protein